MGVYVSSLYVYSAICVTYLVSHYSIGVLSIGVWVGGRYILSNMCIRLYVKVIWCNAIPYIYMQLEWGVYVSSVYGHSAICDSYLV